MVKPATSPWRLAILSRDCKTYARLLTPLLPDCVSIRWCSDQPADIQTPQVQLMLGDPDLLVQVINDCHNVAWAQSTWAGNAPLLRAPKRDYQLTGVKGIFGQQMREYVFAYLLYFARNIAGFKQAQDAGENKWQAPEYNALAGQTLGIAGAGHIASSVASAAKVFGMQVIGLNRSGNASNEYDAVFTPHQKLDFARRCDYVVSLLPDTPATHKFIDAPFLAAMPEHSVLINAGRGVVIDDDALIAALTQAHIRAAVLDVFIEEPLPDTHPYWTLPNTYVTQHTAAISKESDVAMVFHDNLQRWLNDTPLNYVFDFDKGY
ncbi:D-2-hydroxyacid dehydrogenase [Alteromonas gilva]|uniref:D-2-hydroxyacid dehydrogenase n=1 Tax=Alteromonas gilva TaxID=2987522 RepID=A0ABT5L7R6_9ALTE|nr:D-2-hydroxyacid dehydrogenase [Alteromonas gilva]MDC8832541.1 D-2-hydroxyacid dehydrogenase [Alteromonas gilva]